MPLTAITTKITAIAQVLLSYMKFCWGTDNILILQEVSIGDRFR
ncbi:MAG: hypothetical protein PUP90_10145 [Nostoc sp. S4]|nr:hypothetical protein [Nostoc sp. S4]